MENLKEYLRKNNDGEYILEVTDEREAQEPHAKHWIEVPKGCDYLISVFGVNSFIDSDMFAKFKTKNVLWSRKPMKEYLIKSGDGKYLLTHHDSIGAVEIPEVATYYAKDASLGKNGNFFFRLRSDDFDFEAVWLESNWIQAIFNVENQDVLWQRNNNQTIASAVESSHPEELPFIDDEPKITTAKGDELDYIAKTHDMRDRYDGESDEDYRYQLEHYISRKEPSLNDQYAEIETVRHNHYFKDVSDVNRIDVYEVLKRFNVTDPCLQHIIKKALCVGQRGHKDFKNDLQDILDTAKRAVEINK